MVCPKKQRKKKGEEKAKKKKKNDIEFSVLSFRVLPLTISKTFLSFWESERPGRMLERALREHQRDNHLIFLFYLYIYAYLLCQ